LESEPNQRRRFKKGSYDFFTRGNIDCLEFFPSLIGTRSQDVTLASVLLASTVHDVVTATLTGKMLLICNLLQLSCYFM